MKTLVDSVSRSSIVTPVAFGEASVLNYYRGMEELLDAVLVGLGVDPQQDGFP
ncbi:MAG: hypothetical protein HKN72_02540 [Gemmatimonadetes bacterium]|nr:hypothetical protein [Gemmatimonadota bacterium]